ncbi:hypothetical protein H0H93_012090, partial [Arthromyces matolae]
TPGLVFTVLRVPDGNNQEQTIFVKDMTTRKEIRDGFRVFTNPEIHVNDHPPISDEGANSPVQTYTESRMQIVGDEHRANSGAWSTDGANTYEVTALVPESLEQNGISGKLYAIALAASNTPTDSPLTIHCSSKTLTKILLRGIKTPEDLGWINTPNSKSIRLAVATLRSRTGRVDIRSTGEPSSIAKATELAAQTAQTLQNTPAMDVTNKYTQQGAKLTHMTQALLYRGILEQKNKPARRWTSINLDRIRFAIREITGTPPTDEDIWKSIKHKDFSKKVRAFLWKATHNAYKVGEYWQNKGDKAHWGECMKCGLVESLEHILTECENTPAGTIWKLAEELWNRKTKGRISWPKPDFGTQLGCGLATFKSDRNETLRGTSRFYHIIMSESTHLIWKIRCEWKIGRDENEDDVVPPEAVEARWWNALNKRLKMECLQTNKNRYGKKALNSQMVVNTWTGILQDEENLEDDWFMKPNGVLVGRGGKRPPGRNR